MRSKQLALGSPEGAPKRLLSIDEAAQRLGVCRKTVENLIARKELKAVRIGRRVLIREEDLEDFIRKRLR